MGKSRWLTKWLQTSINGCNIGSKPDIFMKIVSICRFSSVSNLSRHMTITSDISKWVIQNNYQDGCKYNYLNRNYSTPPLINNSPCKLINHHIFCSNGDILMNLLAKYRFSHINNPTKYYKLIFCS